MFDTSDSFELRSPTKVVSNVPMIPVNHLERPKSPGSMFLLSAIKQDSQVEQATEEHQPLEDTKTQVDSAVK